MKKHLTDGELRAALDGELDVERFTHLEGCSDCRRRQSQLQSEQAQVARQLAFLAHADDPVRAPQKAWDQFSQRLSTKKGEIHV